MPIARFPIEERDHLPISEPERWGFTSSQVGVICHLSRRITDQDWEALNERFLLPSNIGYRSGLIRDNDNRVDFVGVDELAGLYGIEPIEAWEKEERQRKRTYGWPGPVSET